MGRESRVIKARIVFVKGEDGMETKAEKVFFADARTFQEEVRVSTRMEALGLVSPRDLILP